MSSACRLKLTLRPVLWIAIASAAVASAAIAQPSAPTDCSRPETQARILICGSSTLIALDQENSKLLSLLISSESSAVVRQRYIADHAQWLEERDRCTQQACLASTTWQRNARLRRALERTAPQLARGVAETAPTISELERRIASETPPSAHGGNAAAGQSPRRQTPTDSRANVEARLASTGWTMLIEGSDGAKLWWKRAPEMDRNGWIALVHRSTGPEHGEDEIPMLVRCRLREFAFPIGADRDLIWLRPERGSGLARVVDFACSPRPDGRLASSDNPSAKRSTRQPEPVGPELDDSVAATFQFIRLGRCAARFAHNGRFGDAEQVMGLSGDRQLTRATYVAVLQSRTSDLDRAAENWDDACDALGVDERGLNPERAERFRKRLTAFEAANPGVQPAQAVNVARSITAQAQAADLESRRALAASDPVEALRVAYLTSSDACKNTYRDVFTSTMAQIRDLRRSTNQVPQWKENPNNPAERAARSQAEVLLSAMRANGCARR